MSKGEVIAYRATSDEISREDSSILVMLLFGPIGMVIEHFLRTRTPQHLVFLQDNLLIFGKKRREIEFNDIEQIILKFHKYTTFQTMDSPNGSITIKTKSAQKYKQRYIKDIYNVVLRIIVEIDKSGFERPQLIYKGFYGKVICKNINELSLILQTTHKSYKQLHGEVRGDIAPVKFELNLGEEALISIKQKPAPPSKKSLSELAAESAEQSEKPLPQENPWDKYKSE